MNWMKATRENLFGASIAAIICFTMCAFTLFVPPFTYGSIALNSAITLLFAVSAVSLFVRGIRTPPATRR